MHTLIVRAQIPGDKQKEFLDYVLAAQKGCRATQAALTQEVTDSSQFCWRSDWPSASDLAKFMRSDVFCGLRGAVAVLGRLISVEVGDLKSAGSEAPV